MSFADGDLVDFHAPNYGETGWGNGPIVRGRYIGAESGDYWCEVEITKVFTTIGGFAVGELFNPAQQCLRLVPPLEQLAEEAE